MDLIDKSEHLLDLLTRHNKSVVLTLTTVRTGVGALGAQPKSGAIGAMT